ncbi:4a-hydroxytetrahydrobiopterin dehydratase [Celeribacter sp. ULVN23_4]
MTELLKGPARTEALAPLLANGWTETSDGTGIEKRFTFRNFVEAFGFMTRVALIAEKRDHHPDWRNVYRTVEVTLSTHDAGGLTEKDIELALQMDEATAHA